MDLNNQSTGEPSIDNIPPEEKLMKDEYLNHNIKYNEEQKLQGMMAQWQIQSKRSMKEAVDKIEAEMKLSDSKLQV